MKVSQLLALVDEMRVRGVMQFSIGNVMVVIQQPQRHVKKRNKPKKRIGFK